MGAAIITLLLVLILPLGGTQKRRKNDYTEKLKTELSKTYYVNEQGELIEMSKQNIG